MLAPDSPLGPPAAGVDAILDKFTALRVTGSGMLGLAVIDVPPDVDLYLVRQLLDTGQRDGWWDYDELCVTDAWKTAVGHTTPGGLIVLAKDDAEGIPLIRLGQFRIRKRNSKDIGPR